MSNPHVPLFAVATVNDDVLPETTDPDFSFDYVDISSISDFHVSDTLARFTFREAPSRARRLAQPGDIALSTVRTYLRAIAPITEQHADSVFSTGFAIIRPKPSVLNSSFLQYAALSTDFIDSIVSHSNGVSYPAINATDVMRFRIPLPPLETQQRIADYLDRETSEIDAAVADLDKYIKLLREREEIFVEDLLCKSEFPKVPLFTFCQLSSGDGISKDDFEESGRFPVYGGNGIMGYSDRSNRSRDTLVVGRVGALCGNVHYAKAPFFVTDNALVLSLKSDVSLDWLQFALRDLRLRDLSQSSAQPVITATTVLRQRVNLPPAHRQLQIASRICEETTEIDALVAESTKLRDLLLKRRSVLITEVVTGRKQV